MKQFFREHWLGLVLSIVIGILIALPPIWFRFSADYRGFPMLKNNTEAHYMAQVQEVYDGYHGLGNNLYADLKDSPYLFPLLPPNIIWGIGQILFLDTIQVIVVTRFLFSVLLAFTIYLFALKLTANKLVALVSAPFVMLAYGLVDPMAIISWIKTGAFPSEHQFLHYGRPINPSISSLFFFGYLLFFWQFLYEPAKTKVNGTLATLLLGLSFYVYLFTWTFILTLNGFFFLIFLCKKDWVKVKKIMLVSVGGVLIGSVYWINYWQAAHHSWYEESATRFGFVPSRALNISRLVFGVLVAFAVTYKILDQRVREFFLAFFPTAIFVVNEQLITGYYIFNHHYHWNYNTPLVIILITIIIFALCQKFIKNKFIAPSIAMLLILGCLGAGVTEQKISYSAAVPSTIAEQRYASVFNWLKSETKKDETVLAAYEMTDYIPALTHNNVFYSSSGVYTLFPTERLENQYVAYHYLEGIPKKGYREYLEERRVEVSYFLFAYTYRFQEENCLTCFPNHFLGDLDAKYQNLTDKNFLEFLKQYPLDYIIWDKTKNPNWRLDRFNWSIIKDFGEIVVYDVRG